MSLCQTRREGRTQQYDPQVQFRRTASGGRAATQLDGEHFLEFVGTIGREPDASGRWGQVELCLESQK